MKILKIWDERPKDLKGAELIAWALTTVADAIDGYNPSDFAVSGAIDKLSQTLDGVGMVSNVFLDRRPCLEHLAERVGGNLERIADAMEKPQPIGEPE